MILLVVATGRLGEAVAKRLSRDGVKFRAACRNVSKAKWLADRGVEVLHYDAATGDGLPDMFVGITQVVCCILGLFGKSRHSIDNIDLRGQANLIDACSNAAIGRFVCLGTRCLR